MTISHETLLAYVEGDLDHADASSLRERLVDEPRLVAALDAMRIDRARLRTLGEAEPSVDFIAGLESQLARPMLMDQDEIVDGRRIVRPGAYRRRANRQRRFSRYAKMAAAAGLVLTAGLAVWAGVGSLIKQQNPHLADATNMTLDSVEPIGATTDRAEAIAPHRMMEESVPQPPVLVDQRPAVDVPVIDYNGTPILIDGFALRLDGADVERALVAATMTGDGALVRNFTFAEALALDTHLRSGSGARDGQDDWMADSRSSGSVSRADRERLAARIDARVTDRAMPPEIRSRHLAGARDQAADFEQQLMLSEAGATHTVSITVGDLEALLQSLRIEHGVDAQASRLGDAAAEDASWLGTWGDWRAMIDGVRRAGGDDAIVVVPIVIE